MSVFIYDAEALQKMGKVEGPEWLKYQRENRTNPFCFYSFLHAWQETSSSGIPGATLRDIVPLGAVIYGKGGRSQWAVNDDGRIVLGAGATSVAFVTSAKREGFDVT